MIVIVNMFLKKKMKNYIKKFQIYWDYMRIQKIKYILNRILLFVIEKLLTAIYDINKFSSFIINILI